ncbi:hypothetical protein BC827DRAFT_1233056, partial [Russula dissimulans]
MSNTLDFAVPCPNLCQSVDPFLGSPARVSISALLFSYAHPSLFSSFFHLPYSKTRHPLDIVSNQRRPLQHAHIGRHHRRVPCGQHLSYLLPIQHPKMLLYISKFFRLAHVDHRRVYKTFEKRSCRAAIYSANTTHTLLSFPPCNSKSPRLCFLSLSLACLTSNTLLRRHADSCSKSPSFLIFPT